MSSKHARGRIRTTFLGVQLFVKGDGQIRVLLPKAPGGRPVTRPHGVGLGYHHTMLGVREGYADVRNLKELMTRHGKGKKAWEARPLWRNNNGSLLKFGYTWQKDADVSPVETKRWSQIASVSKANPNARVDTGCANIAASMTLKHGTVRAYGYPKSPKEGYWIDPSGKKKDKLAWKVEWTVEGVDALTIDVCEVGTPIRQSIIVQAPEDEDDYADVVVANMDAFDTEVWDDSVGAAQPQPQKAHAAEVEDVDFEWLCDLLHGHASGSVPSFVPAGIGDLPWPTCIPGSW